MFCGSAGTAFWNMGEGSRLTTPGQAGEVVRLSAFVHAGGVPSLSELGQATGIAGNGGMLFEGEVELAGDSFPGRGAARKAATRDNLGPGDSRPGDGTAAGGGTRKAGGALQQRAEGNKSSASSDSSVQPTRGDGSFKAGSRLLLLLRRCSP